MIVLFVSAVGCSSGDRGQVPAVGHVTLDGVPLDNVYVTFRPDDGEPGRGGFAVTDADGRFEIYYPDTGKGLIPARYQVTVTAPPLGGADSLLPDVYPAEGDNSFPSVYSSPERTPLRVVVPSEEDSLQVELSSHPGKG